MIYSGQELGERGMDLEGFSGIDGRTTIFDYWGVKTLQEWANKGMFDGAKMNESKREIRAFYQNLLTLAREDKAIQKGAMYDITYAQGEGFDKKKQFAFLREIIMDVKEDSGMRSLSDYLMESLEPWITCMNQY
jgi:hypothetical protein